VLWALMQCMHREPRCQSSSPCRLEACVHLPNMLVAAVHWCLGMVVAGAALCPVTGQLGCCLACMHTHTSMQAVWPTDLCRWQDRLHSGSCLATKRVDVLMLDTTYALPKHTFPPQEEAIAMLVEVSRSHGAWLG